MKAHNQMEKNRNNCFGSKKRDTTLYQAKMGKHEYGKIVSI